MFCFFFAIVVRGGFEVGHVLGMRAKCKALSFRTDPVYSRTLANRFQPNHCTQCSNVVFVSSQPKHLVSGDLVSFLLFGRNRRRKQKRISQTYFGVDPVRRSGSWVGKPTCPPNPLPHENCPSTHFENVTKIQLHKPSCFLVMFACHVCCSCHVCCLKFVCLFVVCLCACFFC